MCTGVSMDKNTGKCLLLSLPFLFGTMIIILDNNRVPRVREMMHSE